MADSSRQRTAEKSSNGADLETKTQPLYRTSNCSGRSLDHLIAKCHVKSEEISYTAARVRGRDDDAVMPLWTPTGR
jgi:hypothetical protein